MDRSDVAAAGGRRFEAFRYALLLVTLVVPRAAVADERRFPIAVTCVDEEATGYGTFQSHNQKVLANKGGIFMTHIRSRNEAYTAQQWRLSRSTDGGRTFATLHEATDATNPPALETDDEGNLYLVRPDFVDGNAYLCRFAAADNYRLGPVTPIPNGAAQKFALCYDPGRRQLYYASYTHFHVLGDDGEVRLTQRPFQNGPHAEFHYPYLTMGGGTLYLAWTSVAHGRYLYWDIHCIQSVDGGATWQKLDGTPLTRPIVADNEGPTDRIVLDDELEIHTWLSNFSVRGGKAHFMYLAGTTPPRQHYVRLDASNGTRELDIMPVFRGEEIELFGLDGFFAADANSLYCVGHTRDSRIGCLRSDDNGSTWHDHALSDTAYEGIYALGGCRDVTGEGDLLGSFTVSKTAADGSSASKVYFLRIRGKTKRSSRP